VGNMVRKRVARIDGLVEKARAEAFTFVESKILPEVGKIFLTVNSLESANEREAKFLETMDERLPGWAGQFMGREVVSVDGRGSTLRIWLGKRRKHEAL